MARSIVTLTAALLMPFYGRLIKKTGAKKVLLASTLMLGLTAIGYSFSVKLWHFYLFAFINGLFYNGLYFLSIGVLISAWFKGQRGLATGLAYSGSGLGGAVLIPVIGNIIDFSGWQWAYRFMGIFGIAVMAPIIIFFIKNAPEDMGLVQLEESQMEHKSGPAPAAVNNLSFREAMRTKTFWLLTPAFFFINFTSAAANTHTAPYLSDLGYMTAYISSVISLYMISIMIGKIVLGSVYDRAGALAGNLVVSVFGLAFPILALFARNPAIPWIYAMVVGIASGGVSVPVAVLITRHFGDKDLPALMGFYMMLINIAPSISLPAMGAVFDYTGSYKPAWIAFIFSSAIVSFCLIKVELPGNKTIRNLFQKQKI